MHCVDVQRHLPGSDVWVPEVAEGALRCRPALKVLSLHVGLQASVREAALPTDLAGVKDHIVVCVL